jgi:hypothetical protein
MTSSQSLRKPNMVYLSTFENKTVTLTCQIDANPRIYNINWYYYQVNKENKVINKVSLNLLMKNLTTSNINSQQNVYYTHISLSSVASSNTGYYACEINYILNDNLNQTFIGIADATYYLQVQCESFSKDSFLLIGRNFLKILN